MQVEDDTAEETSVCQKVNKKKENETIEHLTLKKKTITVPTKARRRKSCKKQNRKQNAHQIMEPIPIKTPESTEAQKPNKIENRQQNTFPIDPEPPEEGQIKSVQQGAKQISTHVEQKLIKETEDKSQRSNAMQNTKEHTFQDQPTPPKPPEFQNIQEKLQNTKQKTLQIEAEPSLGQKKSTPIQNPKPKSFQIEDKLKRTQSTLGPKSYLIRNMTQESVPKAAEKPKTTETLVAKSYQIQNTTQESFQTQVEPPKIPESALVSKSNQIQNATQSSNFSIGPQPPKLIPKELTEDEIAKQNKTKLIVITLTNSSVKGDNPQETFAAAQLKHINTATDEQLQYKSNEVGTRRTSVIMSSKCGTTVGADNQRGNIGQSVDNQPNATYGHKTDGIQRSTSCTKIGTVGSGGQQSSSYTHLGIGGVSGQRSTSYTNPIIVVGGGQQCTTLKNLVTNVGDCHQSASYMSQGTGVKQSTSYTNLRTCVAALATSYPNQTNSPRIINISTISSTNKGTTEIGNGQPSNANLTTPKSLPNTSISKEITTIGNCKPSTSYTKSGTGGGDGQQITGSTSLEAGGGGGQRSPSSTSLDAGGRSNQQNTNSTVLGTGGRGGQHRTTYTNLGTDGGGGQRSTSYSNPITGGVNVKQGTRYSTQMNVQTLLNNIITKEITGNDNGELSTSYTNQGTAGRQLCTTYSSQITGGGGDLSKQSSTDGGKPSTSIAKRSTGGRKRITSDAKDKAVVDTKPASNTTAKVAGACQQIITINQTCDGRPRSKSSTKGRVGEGNVEQSTNDVNQGACIQQGRSNTNLETGKGSVQQSTSCTNMPATGIQKGTSCTNSETCGIQQSTSFSKPITVTTLLNTNKISINKGIIDASDGQQSGGNTSTHQPVASQPSGQQRGSNTYTSISIPLSGERSNINTIIGRTGDGQQSGGETEGKADVGKQNLSNTIEDQTGDIQQNNSSKVMKSNSGDLQLETIKDKSGTKEKTINVQQSVSNSSPTNKNLSVQQITSRSNQKSYQQSLSDSKEEAVGCQQGIRNCRAKADGIPQSTRKINKKTVGGQESTRKDNIRGIKRSTSKNKEKADAVKQGNNKNKIKDDDVKQSRSNSEEKTLELSPSKAKDKIIIGHQIEANSNGKKVGLRRRGNNTEETTANGERRGTNIKENAVERRRGNYTKGKAADGQRRGNNTKGKRVAEQSETPIIENIRIRQCMVCTENFPLKNSNSNSSEGTPQKQLTMIFFLNKFLEHPLIPEQTLADLLTWNRFRMREKEGNKSSTPQEVEKPSLLPYFKGDGDLDWNWLCDNCHTKVERARTVCMQIVDLEDRLSELRDGIVNKVVSTINKGSQAYSGGLVNPGGEEDTQEEDKGGPSSFLYLNVRHAIYSKGTQDKINSSPEPQPTSVTQPEVGPGPDRPGDEGMDQDPKATPQDQQEDEGNKEVLVNANQIRRRRRTFDAPTRRSKRQHQQDEDSEASTNAKRVRRFLEGQSRVMRSLRNPLFTKRKVGRPRINSQHFEQELEINSTLDLETVKEATTPMQCEPLPQSNGRKGKNCKTSSLDVEKTSLTTEPQEGHTDSMLQKEEAAKSGTDDGTKDIRAGPSNAMQATNPKKRGRRRNPYWTKKNGQQAPPIQFEDEDEKPPKLEKLEELLEQAGNRRLGRCTLKSRTCPVCKRIFISPSKMLVHLNVKHVKKILFYCETCSRGFLRKDYLRDHERVHWSRRRKQTENV